jgi:segregation and condensation protein B
MDREEMKRILESLIFVADRSLDVGTASKILENSDKAEILAVLQELKREYEEKDLSFHIIEVAGGFQMCTRSVYSNWIRKLFQARLSNKLSKPSLETLAIIAYKQPVVKADIDFIRGVNSDAAVNTLLDRNLIRIVGRQEVAGRPFLYGTTKDFMQQFGLKDLNELPSLPEIQDLVDQHHLGDGQTPQGSGAPMQAETLQETAETLPPSNENTVSGPKEPL